MIQPVSASFIPGEYSRVLPGPATAAPPPRPNTSMLSRLRSVNLNPFRTVHIQDIIDELASRDLHARLAAQRPTQPTQAELAAAAFGIPPPPSSGDGNTDQAEIERPKAVRVAVLIAMPDPARPISGAKRESSYSEAASSSSSTRTASSSGAETAKADEEPELPYVEFGIATVPFVPASPSTSSEPSSRPPV